MIRVYSAKLADQKTLSNCLPVSAAIVVEAFTNREYEATEVWGG